MSYSTILNELRLVLLSVAGIGNVHDRRRNSTFWDKYYASHRVGGQVNNWEISRTSLKKDVNAVQGAGGVEPLFHVEHEIEIRGHMSFSDGNDSETQFQTLLERIHIALTASFLLNGTLILPLVDTDRAINIEIGHETLGGVLCHLAKINLSAIERIGG